MLTALIPFIASASLLCGGTPDSPYGYLWFYRPDGHGGTVKEVCPYVPHEGDILFETMVMITSGVARFGSLDLMRGMGKSVPYRGRSSVFGNGPLDLIARS